MQIGNSIGLTSNSDISPQTMAKKLFKLVTFRDLVECMSVIAAFMRGDKEIYIQILNKDRYKFHEVRVAYFAFLGDLKDHIAHDGRTVEQMHKEFKAKYLIEIICASPGYEWFADLVLKSVGDEPEIETAVNKLITISDGSIVTTAMLRKYFKAVEMEVLQW